MAAKQGDLELLQYQWPQEFVAVRRFPLAWPIPDRWNARVGSHLVPLEWTRVLLMGNSSQAPKLKALAKNPKVALTIDDNTFPHKVLLVARTARLDPVDGIVPEYAQAAERYFGPEQGRGGCSSFEPRCPA